MRFITRYLEARLRFAMLEDSVIYLTGPRSAGKNSLYLSLKEEFPFLTFDDENKLAAAKENPSAFIRSLPDKIIIDNAPVAPEIFKPMGVFVDELRRSNNGYVAARFLLTGICNIKFSEYIQKNLLGRLKIITLLPFAAAENSVTGDINFIYNLFTKSSHNKKFKNSDNIIDIMNKATFTEISLREVEDTDAWYKNYIKQLVKDIAILAKIEDTKNLEKLIKLLASKIGESFDRAKLADLLGTTTEEIIEYLALLHNFYFLILIPSFDDSKNHGIYMMDTRLWRSIAHQDSMDDSAIKNFVASELTKHIEYLEKYQYRLFSSVDVDFIVENTQDETIIALDFKHDVTVLDDDFKGLRKLQKEAGKKFIKGVVLYRGTEIVNFGEDLFAMPICTLWGGE